MFQLRPFGVQRWKVGTLVFDGKWPPASRSLNGGYSLNGGSPAEASLSEFREDPLGAKFMLYLELDVTVLPDGLDQRLFKIHS